MDSLVVDHQKFHIKLNLFYTVLNWACVSKITKFEPNRSPATQHSNPWKVSFLQPRMSEWENATAPLV